jgi:hypothetical protein
LTKKLAEKKAPKEVILSALKIRAGPDDLTLEASNQASVSELKELFV